MGEWDKKNMGKMGSQKKTHNPFELCFNQFDAKLLIFFGKKSPREQDYCGVLYFL